MINCRNCTHWVDESLAQIEADRNPQHPHVFAGCRIFGFIQNTELNECAHYAESENLFTICAGCGLPVPKVCVSLGECINCTNTDLFCVDHCMGGENRKYCTHFVRLHTQGVQLIGNNEVFDLFPTVGMPGQPQPSPSDPPQDKDESR
jgi:hypothetical protein